jgi:Na+/proline symporter
MTDDAVARLARMIVVPLGGISLYLAIYRSATLVSLLLLGYSGMVQFFPGVVLGLFWTRVSQTAVFSGMAGGVVTVVALASLRMDPLWGFNGGFVGLCLNCLIIWVMSALRPLAPAQPEEAAFLQPRSPVRPGKLQKKKTGNEATRLFAAAALPAQNRGYQCLLDSSTSLSRTLFGLPRSSSAPD